jgi:hypothetical protein
MARSSRLGMPWERVEREVRADPVRCEGVSPVEREVRAWVRLSNSSEVGCGLHLVTRTRPEPGVVWRSFVRFFFKSNYWQAYIDH